MATPAVRLTRKETLANLRHVLGDFFGITPEGVHNTISEASNECTLSSGDASLTRNLADMNGIKADDNKTATQDHAKDIKATEDSREDKAPKDVCDGDQDLLLGVWGPPGHLYENSLYDETTPAAQKRHVRVRVVRDSEAVERGLATEFGAAVELLLHDEPGRLRRRKTVTSAAGYLNQN